MYHLTDFFYTKELNNISNAAYEHAPYHKDIQLPYILHQDESSMQKAASHQIVKEHEPRKDRPDHSLQYHVATEIDFMLFHLHPPLS